MARWDPWRGCHRYSEGCKFCYIHKGDAKRDVDTNQIVRTDDFYKPIARKKNGEYKMKPGLVYVCFSSDFLLDNHPVIVHGSCKPVGFAAGYYQLHASF